MVRPLVPGVRPGPLDAPDRGPLHTPATVSFSNLRPVATLTVRARVNDEPSCSLPTRPLWLSPFQVVVIPVGTEQEEYAREVRSWGSRQGQSETNRDPKGAVDGKRPLGGGRGHSTWSRRTGLEWLPVRMLKGQHLRNETALWKGVKMLTTEHLA